jgi:hypothetical protein
MTYNRYEVTHVNPSNGLQISHMIYARSNREAVETVELYLEKQGIHPVVRPVAIKLKPLKRNGNS